GGSRGASSRSPSAATIPTPARYTTVQLGRRARVHPVKKFSREGKKALTRVRRICLALPETTEKISWGTPKFRVKGTKGKILAMFQEDHHGDGRLALWCNAPKRAQQ